MPPVSERAVLSKVSGFIAERMGLHFPEERWPDLACGIKTAGPELGFESFDDCARWLTTRELTVRQIETLASHLTIGETYFFRNPESFELLEREILPPLVAKRTDMGRTLRLWSAGCCTGEEAYSLAMSCTRIIPNLRDWNVSILATDINPKFLAKAEAGVYSEWSFRGTEAGLRDRFFSPAPDKKYMIEPGLKKLIHFTFLNLAEDAYPSLHNHTNAMDVIFCRNVIMYFTPDHQRRVVAALHRSLVDGGCLIVNPAEASASLFPMFAVENIDGVIVCRKGTRPSRGESWPGLASPAPAFPEPAPADFVAPAMPVPVVPITPTPPIALIMPGTGSTREDPLVLARLCANQGRLDEALTWCERAAKAEPTKPAAHFLRATIFHELGRLQDAVEAFGKVLYLDQDFILAHHALGALYHRLGKQKESKRHLAVALQLLAARSQNEVLPESDGMTCGRLLESVRAMSDYIGVQ